mgnify:CR=1 FL=1
MLFALAAWAMARYVSAPTNGRLAVQGWRDLERRVGRPLAHLSEGSEERRISFADTQNIVVQ